MKIVVNDIAASTGGAMTVLKDFYTCVCENDTENEWVFLLADRYFEETENVKILTLPEVKKSSVKKVIFDFFTGKKFIGKLKPDVVFSLQNIITFGLKIPQVVYIHQSLPFQKIKKFSFLKCAEIKLALKQYVVGAMIKLSAKKADKVIVQTKWMKEAVCQQCKIPKKNVLNFAPGVNNISHLKDSSLYDKKTFFYPTAPAIYKNNNCIFEASALLEKQNTDHSVVLTLPTEYSKPNVDCIGRIPYEEVINKYNTATLIFPSYIETFGYPLAEARQMGAIVLAADTEFARELLDGYENAYFFNPFKPYELAELMEQVIKGKIIKKSVENTCVDTRNSWLDVMNQVTNNFLN